MRDINLFQVETQGFRRRLSVDLKDPWSKSYHGRHEYKGLRALHLSWYVTWVIAFLKIPEMTHPPQIFALDKTKTFHHGV